MFRLVFTHLNINSIRNIFELLIDQAKGNVDPLMLSETSSDDRIHVGKFFIEADMPTLQFLKEQSLPWLLSPEGP